MTIMGTRPEIIRLSRVIPLLDQHCEHVVVHTGQNFDRALHDIFFEELGLRRPDVQLECRGDSAMTQVAKIIIEIDRLFDAQRPDRVLILGDTNSGLAAFVAKRRGIAVFHMEAGNRCFDDRVPEEVNRRVIDQSSDVLMPYTERSRANLLREGLPSHRIFVTGNPIKEVLDHHAARIDASEILSKLSLAPGGYFLATLHRAENVDVPERLARFVEAFKRLHAEHRLPIVLSVHPRTRSRLQSGQHKLDAQSGVLAHEPFGLFDFVKLQKNARCVLSDSGTVQEECCILQVPNVTIRDVTERPETTEVGSNLLSGSEPASILSCVAAVVSRGATWQPPPEYLRKNVSTTVLNITLGYSRPI